MTQDEVLNLARQAEGQVTMWVNHNTTQKTTTFTFESPIDYYVSGEYPEKYHIKFLEAFAKLVTAKTIAELESQEPVKYEHKAYTMPVCPKCRSFFCDHTCKTNLKEKNT